MSKSPPKECMRPGCDYKGKLFRGLCPQDWATVKNLVQVKKKTTFEALVAAGKLLPTRMKETAEEREKRRKPVEDWFLSGEKEETNTKSRDTTSEVESHFLT